MSGKVVKALGVVVWDAARVKGVTVNRERIVNLQDLEILPGALLDLIVDGLPEGAESEFYFDGIQDGIRVNGREYISAASGARFGQGRIEVCGG